jgi:hypothetical protein
MCAALAQASLLRYHGRSGGRGGSEMNPFKAYTLTWWQIGIFKLALLAIGVAVGAYWHELFASSLTVLIVIAGVAGAYIAYVTLKQH